MLPLIVSHVSRKWRAVALQTPSLWRRISLDTRLRLWTAYIQRAKACTLDIEITPQTPIVSNRTVRRGYLAAQTVQVYMHMVTPHLPRWRSLTIEFRHYAPYLWNAALSECCGHNYRLQAPYLEHLTLVHSLNDDTKEFTLFNGYAPRLRSAFIQGIRLTWLPSLFANLTALDYTHHGFTRGNDACTELYYMLQVSSRLRELRLAFPPPRSHYSLDSHLPDIPGNTRVHLDHLHTLELYVSSGDIPSALIQLVARIRLRALRSLSLRSPMPPTPSRSNRYPQDFAPILYPPFYRLPQFLISLSRFSKVTHLRVDNSWCDRYFVLSLLKSHVTHLKHLTLASAHVNDAFLWALGDDMRRRYQVSYPIPKVELVGSVKHPEKVSYATLDVLEVINARISGEGLLAVVRRMLGGGVVWVKEVWVKDCQGVDGTVMQRADRFGVGLKVWGNDDGQGRAESRGSMWRKLRR